MVPVKILVVDDEVEMERLIEQRFRKQIKAQELEFIFAANGVEALHKLQDNGHVDMVLTDLNMPHMDGLTLIEQLTKVDETLKAVVMSAYSDMPNIRQAMNRGAVDFLAKPIDFQDLEKTIQKTKGFVHQVREKQLKERKAQEKLIQLERYKRSALRKSISLSLPHEINTPLNGILGFTELLSRYYSSMPQEEVLEIIEDIRTSATRLNKVCQSFLLYVKFELLKSNPQQTAQLKEMSANSVRFSIEEWSQGKAREYNRERDLHLGIADGTLWIYEPFLKTVVEEILDNAFKFSEIGTRVLLVSSIVDEQFVMYVRDRGRGMTKAQIANLGAYMQFDREFYEQQGLGLGLATVKRIVDFYGGEFAIESCKKMGTTVTIRLPIAKRVAQSIS
ncbi:response regulator [Pseudanabaena sp. PCC 6802]|uniref:hybrid sensor histidine kinase/response regulator n=1 Tax=Pseudanabaena sp. PCC 6802 TaxID=118173 RepID=UPI00034B5206|nr:response regulator [Pseudanabaena sp. PCC 6802]